MGGLSLGWSCSVFAKSFSIKSDLEFFDLRNGSLGNFSSAKCYFGRQVEQTDGRTAINLKTEL
uniref:Uncharacterized protein n=1 Tax=Romanomermis culicivorax TaxID=13658 RepID=A0A915HZJ2_ROMCU